MKIMFGIATACVLLTGILFAQEGPDARIYQRGFDALLKHRWDEARTAFEEIVRDYPRSSWAGGAQIYLCTIKEQTGASGNEVFECYQSYLSDHPHGSWADVTRRNMMNIARRLADGGDTTYQRYLKHIRVSGSSDEQLALLSAFGAATPDIFWPVAAELYDHAASVEVRAMATSVLGMVTDDPRAIPKLASISRNDVAVLVRAAAAQALCHLGGDASLSPLNAILGSNDSLAVRKAALSGIYRIEPAKAIPFYLEWATKPGLPELRKDAVAALASLKTEQKGEILLKLLKESPYPDVRRAVLAQYLGQRSPAPVAEIAQLLRGEQNIDVRVAAAAALGTKGSDDGIEVLLAVIRGTDPEKVKSTARLALSHIGTPRAQAALDEARKRK